MMCVHEPWLDYNRQRRASATGEAVGILSESRAACNTVVTVPLVKLLRRNNNNLWTERPGARTAWREHGRGHRR